MCASWLSGMPIPVSETVKLQQRALIAPLLDLDEERDLAPASELDGIANQVQNDLAQTGGVAPH